MLCGVRGPGRVRAHAPRAASRGRPLSTGPCGTTARPAPPLVRPASPFLPTQSALGRELLRALKPHTTPGKVAGGYPRAPPHTVKLSAQTRSETLRSGDRGK